MCVPLFMCRPVDRKSQYTVQLFLCCIPVVSVAFICSQLIIMMPQLCVYVFALCLNFQPFGPQRSHIYLLSALSVHRNKSLCCHYNIDCDFDANEFRDCDSFGCVCALCMLQICCYLIPVINGCIFFSNIRSIRGIRSTLSRSFSNPSKMLHVLNQIQICSDASKKHLTSR